MVDALYEREVVNGIVTRPTRSATSREAGHGDQVDGEP